MHTVSIRNFTFAPATIAAAPGDTIVWKNEDFVPHTATAKDSVFRSGDIAGGAVWRTVVAAAGHHEYICLYHPAMRAVVDVK